MGTFEMPKGQRGAIYNYFEGATIHKLVINGGMIKKKAKHYYQSESLNHKKESQKCEHDDPTLPCEDDLVASLKPIFFNNEEDVRLFLKEIDGMKPNDITVLVNKWVNEKRISDFGNSRKGLLWTILYDAGLYHKSKQNWNRRVF